MSDPAQGRLNPTDDDRRVLERLAAALGVDDYRAIRTLAALVIRGIAIVVAQAAVGGIAVDHGIHVAAGHPKIQVRPP